MSKAYKTPVADLLDEVPEDIVLGVQGNEPVFKSYNNIPIGQLAKEAAAEIRRLMNLAYDQHTEIYGLRLEVRNLLEALKLCEGNISSLLASAHPKVYGEWLTVVSAAIAKSTGEKP